MTKTVTITGVLMLTLLMGSGVYYDKYKTQTNLYNQQVIQNRGHTNRINSLNNDVDGLSNLVKSYGVKFSEVQTNLQSLAAMVTILQKDSGDKETKITQLLNEKTALEADSRVLRNTIVKLTGDINVLNQKLHMGGEHTESGQLDTMLETIKRLTQERDSLYVKLKDYEATIAQLKQENGKLALVKRQDLEKLGYKFPNNVGEANKSHYLITVNVYDGSIDEVKLQEPKKETVGVATPKSQKKPGFWKRVFAQ